MATNKPVTREDALTEPRLAKAILDRPGPKQLEGHANACVADSAPGQSLRGARHVGCACAILVEHHGHRERHVHPRREAYGSEEMTRDAMLDHKHIGAVGVGRRDA